MTQQIIINGKQHPFKYTLGVQRRLSERGITLNDISTQLQNSNPSALIYTLYECIKSGYNSDGKEFNILFDIFEDNLDISQIEYYINCITNVLPNANPNVKAAPIAAKKKKTNP
jgi:hypothetical protein